MSEQAAGDLRPWVPPGARAFRVGDRVRVRLSGECQQPEWKIEGKWKKGHLPAEEGKVGAVAPWPKSFGPPTQGHSLCVDFDVPLLWKEWGIVATVYAPSELELLTPAPEPLTAHQTALRARGGRESTSDTSDTVRAREAVDSAGEEG